MRTLFLSEKIKLNNMLGSQSCVVATICAVFVLYHLPEEESDLDQFTQSKMKLNILEMKELKKLLYLVKM